MRTTPTHVAPYARLSLHAAILAAAIAAPASAQTGGGFDLSWWSIDCGGGIATAGPLTLSMTLGQPDAGRMTGGTLVLYTGYWSAAAPPCYGNCDGSAVPPILNVADFSCFLNRYAAGDPYANCDGSTTPPILNVADFSCFLNAFAAGCP